MHSSMLTECPIKYYFCKVMCTMSEVVLIDFAWFLSNRVSKIYKKKKILWVWKKKKSIILGKWFLKMLHFI